MSGSTILLLNVNYVVGHGMLILINSLKDCNSIPCSMQQSLVFHGNTSTKESPKRIHLTMLRIPSPEQSTATKQAQSPSRISNILELHNR